LTAEGYTVVDLVAEYRWRDLELELAVDNLTNAAWRDAQFAFESRLMSEVEPVEDIHFTPGVPLSARASLTYRF
jgi:outer membrane receptor protein involved in Fe transport